MRFEGVGDQVVLRSKVATNPDYRLYYNGYARYRILSHPCIIKYIYQHRKDTVGIGWIILRKTPGEIKGMFFIEKG